MTALEFPAPQHMRALAAANRVRLARAESKRAIADGETTVAEIIADPPEHMASMAIGDLLMCQHRWGRTRMRRLLTSIPMSEGKAICAMTQRQRDELVVRLAPRYGFNEATVVENFHHRPTGAQRVLHLIPEGTRVTGCGRDRMPAWGDLSVGEWREREHHRCAICAYVAAKQGWTVVDA